MIEDGQEYLTIQEACELLGCGRTKMYTYYINQDLLQIKRKVGNRSYLLKEDVEAVNLSEASKDPLHPTATPAKSTEQDSAESKHGHNDPQKTDILLPPKRQAPVEAQERIVTEYISELKQRIHDLEHKNVEKDQLLAQYKSKLLNTVPLIEYSEKVKLKEQELKDAGEKLETTGKALAASEQKNAELEQKSEDLKQLQEETTSKLTRSLEVAVAYQSRLNAEEQRKESLKRLQKRWDDLQLQLDRCGLFEFSRKRKLKEEIQLILSTLRTFQ